MPVLKTDIERRREMQESVVDVIITAPAELVEREQASTNIQDSEIIAKITEVVGSWFRNSDDLNHRECDILNSIAKCYKRQ
jgi:hypothetical protein